eukprot:TRINITY_DN47473_c0_g1_i1.p1 TRINITY_DN47473_c0_g1~~TRINITY_DN47473_c0_g1_i1.p1  ORF type:complete len:715 (+),score=155.07 TRINITY_DN47473_c0_g1_i1:74-2218(+)
MSGATTRDGEDQAVNVTPRMRALAEGLGPPAASSGLSEGHRYRIDAFHELHAPDADAGAVAAAVEQSGADIDSVMAALCEKYADRGARLADWEGAEPPALTRHRITKFYAQHMAHQPGTLAASVAAACADGVDEAMSRLCARVPQANAEDWVGPYPKALRRDLMGKVSIDEDDLACSAWLNHTWQHVPQQAMPVSPTAPGTAATGVLQGLLKEAREEIKRLRFQLEELQKRDQQRVRREEELRKRELRVVEQFAQLRQQRDALDTREAELALREAEVDTREAATLQQQQETEGLEKKGTLRWLRGGQASTRSAAPVAPDGEAGQSTSSEQTEETPPPAPSGTGGLSALRDAVYKLLYQQRQADGAAGRQLPGGFDGLACSVCSADNMPTLAPPIRDVPLPLLSVSAVSFTEVRRRATLRFSYAGEGLQYTVNGADPRGPIRELVYNGKDFVYFPGLDKGAKLPFADIADVLGGLRCLCRRAGVTHNIPPTLRLPAFAPTDGMQWNADEPEVATEEWLRSDDNRLRELQQARSGGELRGEAELELRTLERRSEKFIEAGLKRMEQSLAIREGGIKSFSGGGSLLPDTNGIRSFFAAVLPEAARQSSSPPSSRNSAAAQLTGRSETAQQIRDPTSECRTGSSTGSDDSDDAWAEGERVSMCPDSSHRRSLAEGTAASPPPPRVDFDSIGASFAQQQDGPRGRSAAPEAASVAAFSL